MKIILASLLIILIACTDNQRSRGWGGTSTQKLPKNQKLIHVTWKEADLWYLTRPMRTSENAETYEFIESSNYGLVEGKVVFVESKE